MPPPTPTQFRRERNPESRGFLYAWHALVEAIANPAARTCGGTEASLNGQPFYRPRPVRQIKARVYKSVRKGTRKIECNPDGGTRQTIDQNVKRFNWAPILN